MISTSSSTSEVAEKPGDSGYGTQDWADGSHFEGYWQNGLAEGLEEREPPWSLRP